MNLRFKLSGSFMALAMVAACLAPSAQALSPSTFLPVKVARRPTMAVVNEHGPRPLHLTPTAVAPNDAGRSTTKAIAPSQGAEIHGRTLAAASTEDDGPIWYECASCGYIYDAAEGDPSAGVAPGTHAADLPDDWVCPVCEVGKDALRPIDQ